MTEVKQLPLDVQQPTPDVTVSEGGFSAQLSGIIIFSMELYLGDQICSKCITKSFVS